MKKLKYDTIIFEGIDKSGKDLIKNILFHIDNGKYIHVSRGLLSVLCYNKIFNRKHYLYNIDNYNSTLFVLLTCDYDDWCIRCNLTNEKQTNYELQISTFDEISKDLTKQGLHVLSINTTSNSPYNIAKYIYSYMEELNNEN